MMRQASLFTVAKASRFSAFQSPRSIAAATSRRWWPCRREDDDVGLTFFGGRSTEPPFWFLGPCLHQHRIQSDARGASVGGCNFFSPACCWCHLLNIFVRFALESVVSRGFRYPLSKGPVLRSTCTCFFFLCMCQCAFVPT